MPLKSTRRTRGSVNKASAQNIGMPNGVTVSSEKEINKDSNKISENILNTLQTLGKDVKNLGKGFNIGGSVNVGRPKNEQNTKKTGIAENTEKALAVIGQENNRQIGAKRQIHMRQSQIAIKSAQIVVGNVQGLVNAMNPKPTPSDISPVSIPRNPLNTQQDKRRLKEQEIRTKKSNKVKVSISQGLQNIERFLKEIPNSIKGSLLGPLNLIFEPLGGFIQEVKGFVSSIFGFLGKIGGVFKAIGGFGKKLFLKFTNKKPTADEVLKKGGQAGIGAVYLGNVFKKIFGSDEEEGFLDKLFGGLGSDFLSTLSTLGLGAALAMMIMDGIEASALAEEWGVSQTSAIIGGIFGGTGSGWNNALKKAGQGALLGGTIGTMICPGLGTIVGALLGASIFGILGYIGGEKIAQWIEKVGEEIKKDPSLIVKAIVGLVAGALVLKKVTSAIGSLLGTLAGKIFPTLATDSMSKTVGSAFTSKLTKLGAFVELGAGIALMVNEGLKGIAKASEWGTSETSAFIGAFMGSAESGWKGAFTQAPAGMLVGAGIGTLICPPLGTIVGALLGGGIMGALGYIGGEQIAKDLDKMGSSLTEFFSDPSGTLESANQKLETYKSLQEMAKAKGIKTSITLKKGEAVPEGFVESSQMKGVYYMTDEYLSKILGIPSKTELDAYTPVTNFKDNKGGYLDFREMERQNLKNNPYGMYNTNNSGLPIIPVNDAIIKPDGSIVRTSPNDTIIATKNIPYNLDDVRVNSSKELNQNLSEFFTSGGNGSLSQKLDRMISLMGQFVDKQISVELPPQNRADLELLMAGGAL